MKKVSFLFFLFLNITACNSKDKDVRLINEINEKTFTTQSFNYTSYDLFNISFKQAGLPFSIDDAPNGGSVFFRTPRKQQTNDGIEFTAGREGCCLIWDTATDKPLRIRIIWSVVFNIDLFDGKSKTGYDREKSKESAPGSRWCEAIIDILPLNSAEKPDQVFFHFLPDGTVKANLGTFNSGLPLPALEVEKHSKQLPPGQYCQQETENPFFGVPRKPHME